MLQIIPMTNEYGKVSSSSSKSETLKKVIFDFTLSMIF